MNYQPSLYPFQYDDCGTVEVFLTPEQKQWFSTVKKALTKKPKKIVHRPSVSISSIPIFVFVSAYSYSISKSSTSRENTRRVLYSYWRNFIPILEKIVLIFDPYSKCTRRCMYPWLGLLELQMSAVVSLPAFWNIGAIFTVLFLLLYRIITKHSYLILLWVQSSRHLPWC